MRPKTPLMTTKPGSLVDKAMRFLRDQGLARPEEVAAHLGISMKKLHDVLWRRRQGGQIEVTLGLTKLGTSVIDGKFK